jgi:hypothetical protein
MPNFIGQVISKDSCDPPIHKVMAGNGVLFSNSNLYKRGATTPFPLVSKQTSDSQHLCVLEKKHRRRNNKLTRWTTANSKLNIFMSLPAVKYVHSTS